MALDINGILQPIQFYNERPTVISAVAREIFVNEAPLMMRLPRVPGKEVKYTKTIYDVRQRAYTVGTGGITNSATSLPIADGSPFMVGDVLELSGAAGTERVEVTADPGLGTTPNTLTIRRGREGTSGLAFTAGETVTLVGNSRTGAEVNQTGTRAVRSTLDFYAQTFQFPVQVGGLAEALSGNTPLPNGATSVFGFEKSVKLVEMVRDMEYTSYYGVGEDPGAAGDRGKQKGLKTLIASYKGGANVKTNAGASYTRQGFIADSVQKINDAGGDPDVILCSTDFLTGLDTWVPNKTAYMDSSRTTAVLGFPITEFILPLTAKPMKFIECLQLAKGTAVVLSSNDIRVRELRPEQWVPRGGRGDAAEGDWLATCNIDLDHPQFHAWVSGITSYA